jgi:hypothetical protein
MSSSPPFTKIGTAEQWRRSRRTDALFFVMAGLDPAIHVFLAQVK